MTRAHLGGVVVSAVVGMAAAVGYALATQGPTSGAGQDETPAPMAASKTRPEDEAGYWAAEPRTARPSFGGSGPGHAPAITREQSHVFHDDAAREIFPAPDVSTEDALLAEDSASTDDERSYDSGNPSVAENVRFREVDGPSQPTEVSRLRLQAPNDDEFQADEPAGTAPLEPPFSETTTSAEDSAAEENTAEEGPLEDQPATGTKGEEESQDSLPERDAAATEDEDMTTHRALRRSGLAKATAGQAVQLRIVVHDEQGPAPADEPESPPELVLRAPVRPGLSERLGAAPQPAPPICHEPPARLSSARSVIIERRPVLKGRLKPLKTAPALQQTPEELPSDEPQLLSPNLQEPSLAHPLRKISAQAEAGRGTTGRPAARRPKVIEYLPSSDSPASAGDDHRGGPVRIDNPFAD